MFIQKMKKSLKGWYHTQSLMSGHQVCTQLFLASMKSMHSTAAEGQFNPDYRDSWCARRGKAKRRVCHQLRFQTWSERRNKEEGREGEQNVRWKGPVETPPYLLKRHENENPCTGGQLVVLDGMQWSAWPSPGWY